VWDFSHPNPPAWTPERHTDPTAQHGQISNKLHRRTVESAINLTNTTEEIKKLSTKFTFKTCVKIDTGGDGGSSSSTVNEKNQ